MPLPPFLQKTGKWTLVIGNRLAKIQLIPSVFLCLKNNLNTTPPFSKGSVEQCVYARIPNLSSELFPNNIWHRCVSAIRKIPANKLPTPIKKVRVQLTPTQSSPKLQTQLVCTGVCCDCHPCLALPGSWKGPWKEILLQVSTEGWAERAGTAHSSCRWAGNNSQLIQVSSLWHPKELGCSLLKTNWCLLFFSPIALSLVIASAWFWHRICARHYTSKFDTKFVAGISWWPWILCCIPQCRWFGCLSDHNG